MEDGRLYPHQLITLSVEQILQCTQSFFQRLNSPAECRLGIQGGLGIGGHAFSRNRAPVGCRNRCCDRRRNGLGPACNLGRPAPSLHLNPKLAMGFGHGNCGYIRRRRDGQYGAAP